MNYSRGRTNQTPINAYFCSIIGIIVVVYSVIYAITYVRDEMRELRHEIQTLRMALNDSFYANAEQIDHLGKKMTHAEHALSFRRHYEEELLEEVLPWERCLRFEVRQNCQAGEPPNPKEPPCITDVLEEMLFDTIDAINRSNLTYWVSYGTLLGAARDGQIIPWTTDADLVVQTNIWKRIGKKMYDNSLLDEKGYRFFYDRKYTDMARLCIGDNSTKYKQWEKKTIETENYWDSGYPYVDFYQGVPLRAGNYTVKAGPPCTFTHSQIFPLTQLKLCGQYVNAPRDYRKYLAQIYGPNWITPPTPEERDAHGDYYTACANG
jgi:phosphorylcholine metabolism protein LicD